MWRSKWVVGGAGLVVLVGAMAAWLLRPKPEVQVVTAHVTTGPIVRRVVATGTVQPVTTVEVGTQVSGTVQVLEADYNSMVRAGQVVARLDPALYDAQLQQARGSLAQAEADVANARANVSVSAAVLEGANQVLTRTKRLAEQALVMPSDLDAAEIAVHSDEADRQSALAQLESAQAAVVQATASLEQAKVNLEHTVIRSPIDGIVLERAVDVGQTLAASVQSPELFRIAADLRHVQLEVAIDESDVAGLAPGGPATFEVESYPDEMFHGTITLLRLQPVAEQTATATTVTPSTTTPAAQSVVATFVSYTAIVSVSNDDERLRPGMTAEVTLGGSRRDKAIRIPNAALSFRPAQDVLAQLHEPPAPKSAVPAGSPDDPGLRQVWIYDGKLLKPVTVQTGLSDDGWTELVSGRIESGADVVTSATIQRRRRI